jgi:tetraacyldisaccharide 4'-kinase
MKPVLRFLSLFYQAGCQVKNALYRIRILRPQKAPLAVVSVGNITFGGSEKTPFVATLVEALLNNGFKPAVVTRGYKGKWERSGGVLSDGKSRSGTWTESGDEPFMLSLRSPEIGVFVGKDRLLSCSKAHNLGFEVAVLDDGFQHRRLFRDVDIVLYDPSENSPQREPLSSIKRADILLLKKGVVMETARSRADKFPSMDIFSYSVAIEGFFGLDGSEVSRTKLEGKRALVFCGIARPERFRALLEHTGIEPVHFLAFPDHFPYPPESIEKIIQSFNSHKVGVCLTTEKDAVKIKNNRALQDLPMYFLKVGIRTEEELFDRIFSTIKRRGVPDV